jgi:hypothetical protein
VVALDRIVEASRASRLAPVYSGPVTIDDEIRALADEIVEKTLLRAFAAVEVRAGEVGWEAAVGEYRRGHADGAEFVAGSVTRARTGLRRRRCSAGGRRWVGVIRVVVVRGPISGSGRGCVRVGDRAPELGVAADCAGGWGVASVFAAADRYSVAWTKAAATAMTEADHERFDRYRGAVYESSAVWWTFP